MPTLHTQEHRTEQNPYWGIGPTVGKVLIVCPVTLINVSI